ncbi:tyrosine-type recombinase/integrase [Aerococcus urinaeequi]|uniref:tyrosine-type recombinase/integrase n=1 Tax=Aerococcus urinaeequi TaxID=51665 RepID=UPI003D6AB3D8
MNTAKPIKDPYLLKEVLEVYPTNSKNQLLLLYCLNTGLRISDVLTAKVRESVLGTRELVEQKTGKRKVIALPDKLRQRIMIYVRQEGLAMDDWLFYTQNNPSSHIKRSRADKIIRYAGDMVGITLSAHSLRKTFGYLAYQNGTSLEYLMIIFNHASPRTTLRYIGIEQENIDAFYKSVDIGL